MKKRSKAKSVAIAAGAGTNAFLLIDSFLILVWIAYCLTCLTADFLNFSPDDEKGDVKVVLVGC
jgi:hypothetical protein